MNLNFVTAQAAHWHKGQVRKYTGDPYITHPMAVACFTLAAGGSERAQAAALLHDVVEDCGVSLEQVRHITSPEVADIVYALTDVYTAERYPELNRACRKVRVLNRWLDFRGLAREDIVRDAALVKLADLYSNALSIRQHDPKFWVQYRKEAADWIPVVKPKRPAPGYRALELALRKTLEKA